jgi:two-component system, response regulator
MEERFGLKGSQMRELQFSLHWEGKVNKKIILLIEDDTDDTRLTLRAFKKSSIALNYVIYAYSGNQAMDYLRTYGQPQGQERDFLPDLILLDLKLPGFDGFEILEKIREVDHTKLLPVVIFTSSGQEQDISRCYELGANSFVQKPVNYDRFIETVKDLCNYWLVINKIPGER